MWIPGLNLKTKYGGGDFWLAQLYREDGARVDWWGG